jgi:hypothetical protein
MRIAFPAAAVVLFAATAHADMSPATMKDAWASDGLLQAHRLGHDARLGTAPRRWTASAGCASRTRTAHLRISAPSSRASISAASSRRWRPTSAPWEKSGRTAARGTICTRAPATRPAQDAKKSKSGVFKDVPGGVTLSGTTLTVRLAIEVGNVDEAIANYLRKSLLK